MLTTMITLPPGVIDAPRGGGMGPIDDHEEMTRDEMIRKSFAFLQAIEKKLGLPVSPDLPAPAPLKNAPKTELSETPQETASAPPTRKARPRAEDPQNSRLSHILNNKKRNPY